MSGKNPRVQVTLPADVFETVQRLATVQGRSMSKIIGEIIVDLSPGLAELASVGEHFQALSESQRLALAESVVEADRRLADPLQSVAETMAEMNAQMRELRESSTPLGNTGVRL